MEPTTSTEQLRNRRNRKSNPSQKPNTASSKAAISTTDNVEDVAVDTNSVEDGDGPQEKGTHMNGSTDNRLSPASTSSSAASVINSPSTTSFADPMPQSDSYGGFRVNFQFDPMCALLCVIAFVTRVHRLTDPNHIVFDELHYGKYVSLYMRRTFFFDQHPPLGKQLVAAFAWAAGYSGNFTFSHIGGEYSSVSESMNWRSQCWIFR